MNPQKALTPDNHHQDHEFIRTSYEIALTSAKAGFEPFGALLVKEGKVEATSIDKCIQYADPTAHAELILISEYCRKKGLVSLEEYTLYCNVEPCVMCSGAIHWAKISRVVFGVRQSALQRISTGKEKPSCESLINIGNRKTEVSGPVLEEEGLKILRAFPFQSKKEKHKAYWGK